MAVSLNFLKRLTQFSSLKQVKIQQRISLPFASIVFGLVGCLLSLNLPREQKRVRLLTFLLLLKLFYVKNAVCILPWNFR